MGKILFIDVDGTLTDYENNIPQSAIAAIRMARKNGHKVYICTGRSEAEVYQNIWDIGLDGMIGGNGSYVKDGNTVVMHQLITAEQCRHIVDWCHSRNLEFYLESNNGLFASEHFREAALPGMQEYARRKGRPSNITMEQAFPEMIYGGDLYRDDVNKVSFLLNSYQDHLDSIEEFPDLVANTWGGAGETAIFGDLGVKGISKQTAINTLIDYLHADIRDTIAFGDARIDIPMFEVCAYSVAMGSGGKECKEAADYVTTDTDDDGLYNAFAYLGLID